MADLPKVLAVTAVDGRVRTHTALEIAAALAGAHHHVPFARGQVGTRHLSAEVDALVLLADLFGRGAGAGLLRDGRVALAASKVAQTIASAEGVQDVSLTEVSWAGAVHIHAEVCTRAILASQPTLLTVGPRGHVGKITHVRTLIAPPLALKSEPDVALARGLRRRAARLRA
jgi:hypothetical protein